MEPDHRASIHQRLLRGRGVCRKQGDALAIRPGLTKRVEPEPAFHGKQTLRYLPAGADVLGWSVGSVCRLGSAIDEWPVLANGRAGSCAFSAVLRHPDGCERECRLFDI